jgi:hypothetical protein
MKRVGANEKVHENRLRRAARRQGYSLHKSRRRDPRALDFGALTLRGGGREVGPFRDLLEIERWLDADQAERPYTAAALDAWRTA